MKILHILLSMVGLGILVACKKNSYDTKNGAVYFKDDVIREADYTSFQALNDVFAKDKHQAYYRGRAIDGSNGASFTALDEHYGKDNKSAFYCDNYLDFQLFNTTRKNKISSIPTADVGSFVTIKDEYARDKFRCYYQGTGFAVTDVASFEPLEYRFGKDKAVGYFDLKPIPHSDGNSFTVLSRNFSKDKRNVYFSSTVLDGPPISTIHVIKEATPDSFTTVGMYYATDNVHAFYQDKRLQAADPKSFKEWDAYTTQYATDSTHIYYQEKLIIAADKASFRLLTDDYAQDDKNVFYQSEPIKNCEVASFTVLASGYAKDSKRVYFDGKVLAGADPKSFALVGNEANRDAADKTHSYGEGQRVKREKE